MCQSYKHNKTYSIVLINVILNTEQRLMKIMNNILPDIYYKGRVMAVTNVVAVTSCHD